MAINPTPPPKVVAASSTLRPGMTFFRGIGMIWTIFTYAIILSILVTAIVIAIQNKDINPGLQYLGNKTLIVTSNLNDESIKIIENKGIYVKSESTFVSIWNFLKSIWSFIVIVFIIYYWLKVLTWLFKKVIIQDDSKTTASFLLSILFFFGTQMLFIAVFTDKSIMIPITAMSNFVKALPFIFSPIANMIK